MRHEVDFLTVDPARCGACGHMHYGATYRYRCPHCACSDRHVCKKNCGVWTPA